MNVLYRVRQFWLTPPRAAGTRWRLNLPAWVVSLLLHVSILTGLMFIGTQLAPPPDVLTLTFPPAIEEEMAVSQEFSASDNPAEAIGAPSAGNADGTAAFAPSLALGTSVPEFSLPATVSDQLPTVEQPRIQDDMRISPGPMLSRDLNLRGEAGMGATSNVGAIDSITEQILRSLEDRRTLVVWLLDQSGSLERQRAEIITRFNRIYDELNVIKEGGNEAFKRHESKPLLSAVVSFGERISFLSREPTDDVEQIKQAVASMKTDPSGVELTFQAVHKAAVHYQSYVQSRGYRVMFVIVTDEVGDDEDSQLDAAVKICERLAIPVYCIGVPAPFGRRDARIKYIDPDPKFDQTPVWVNVRQGPESLRLELVQVGSERDNEAMDSGFGPYALTRLCRMTGGNFYSVHPNRDERKRVGGDQIAELASHLSRFFDPELMRAYQPDYVSVKEYKQVIAENGARRALVLAAEKSLQQPIELSEPLQMEFPRVNDADLVSRFDRAQRPAALAEPLIESVYRTLREGEKDRPLLTKERWRAGYDLSMGRVLAFKARTEGYNAMLGKAKQGMAFKDAKSDTWRLSPDDTIRTGSQQEKDAAQAKVYLERVVAEHPETPWALLAEKELRQPMGWKWQEAFTGVNQPKPAQPRANNPPPRRPRDEKANSLPRPEKRPPPKL